MEKDDKIRSQRAKVQKFAVIFSVLTVVLLGFLSWMNKSDAPQATALRRDMQQLEDRVKLVVGSNPEREAKTTGISIDELTDRVKALDAEVRAIKKTNVIMEVDPTSIQKTSMLQEATRSLLRAKYGEYDAYRVRVDLEFPVTIPDFAEKGKDGHIVIEMAPIDLIPVSVYNFLEIARTWIKGSFHRNANHVLQAQGASGIHLPMPFQEYSKGFPHKKGTTGYAGRPSGPEWYVSIQDNTVNHVSTATIHAAFCLEVL